MLSAHCPRHGRTVLVPTSRIESVLSHEDHHLVQWRCSCGTRSTTRLARRQPAI
jgi:hypothetical protein